MTHSFIYITLIGYIFSSIMALMASDGLVAHALFPNKPEIIMLMRPLGVCFMAFFYQGFNILFFNTQINYPRLHYFFCSLMAFASLIILSIPFNLYISLAPILLLSSLLALPFSLYISWIAIRDRQTGSLPIFYGTLLHFFLTIIIVLTALGITSNDIILFLGAQTNILAILFFSGLYQRLRDAEQQQESRLRVEVTEKLRLVKKQRNQSRSTFLNLVAHEIKTPLAVIDSSIQTLETQSNSSNKVSIERHRRIRRSIAQLNTLLENTLTNERYTDDPFKPQLTQFLLASFIRHAIETEFTSKKCHFQVQKNCQCTADRTLLRLALSNLWSNAIKYSPPNTPISLEGRKTFYKNKCGTLLCISNIHTAKEKPNTSAWRRQYYRENKHGTIEGLGLGLFLVQQIAHAHTGNMNCEATAIPATNQWLITISLWLPDTIEDKS